MKWKIAIPAAALAALGGASYYFSSIVLKPKCTSPEEGRKNAGELADIEEYETLMGREQFRLKSEYGYELNCELVPRRADLPPADGRERVVILVHGFTSSLWGSHKYLGIFRNLGFSCVLYDHRNHGNSDKKLTTMGYFEARDLETVFRFARERFGENALIGTHGESMGGATVMLHSALNGELAFVIDDCGYSSLPDELSHNLKAMFRLPRFPLYYTASLAAKLRSGVFWGQVVPKDAVAMAENIPMLFIHGGDDDFVPTAMVYENYNAKRGVRRMKIFPNAQHAESFAKNPEEYTREVEEFLTENGIVGAKAAEKSN